MISVILPVYQEEERIGLTLQRLAQQEGRHEVIVVDGGSRDRTVEIARSYGRVISAPKGRAFQMNEGARYAKGDILFFLHADSHLEAGTLLAIEERMQKKEVVGGCLTQRIEGDRPFYRMLESAGTWRARMFHLFYGDQGIFVRKPIFDKIGKYPLIPLFEDVAFSRCLRKEGKVAVLSKYVFTSPRRWERGGFVRASVWSGLLFFLYGVGIAPQTLARFYPDVR